MFLSSNDSFVTWRRVDFSTQNIYFVACPVGRYGHGCLQECSCDNNAICDIATGKCSCPAGWTGHLCDQRELNLQLCASPVYFVDNCSSHPCILSIFIRSVPARNLWIRLRNEVLVREQCRVQFDHWTMHLCCWMDRGPVH